MPCFIKRGTVNYIRTIACNNAYNLDGRKNSIPKRVVLSKLINLHTFTFVQSISSYNIFEWSIIESLTAPNVMPVLRRMNLAIFLYADDLNRINRSPLFSDDRQVDVQFAFIINDYPLGVQLKHRIPNGSRFHPRQIVGITCDRSWLMREYRGLTNINCYVSNFIITQVSFDNILINN